MNFLKDNSHTISRMLINQIGMMIFGFAVAQATCQNETLFLLASLFSVLFYMVLLYNVAWASGAKDKIRIDGGRMAYRPLKGLLMSLVANIPNLILAVLVIVGYTFGRLDGGFSYEWAGNLYVVSNFIARIFESMYLGLIQLYSPHNPIAFLLIILPALAVCALAYILGAKNIRIAGYFGIKTKDARKAEEQERLREAGELPTPEEDSSDDERDD